MNAPQNTRTLLAAFAHPDDESFGSGGTIAHYAAQGVRVALVCATRGEVGEISDSNLATHDNLGEVREKELRAAVDILGVKDLTFLDYRDSGMQGTADNDHPQAFSSAPEDIIVGELVAAMRRLQPQVVVTFDPNGGYGHPDHIAMHRHTVTAFHASGDPQRYPDKGEPWQPERLFYTAFPRSRFQEMRQRMESLGIDTSAFAEFEELAIVWLDDQINVTMDLSDVIDIKLDALRQHKTQLSPDNPFSQLPEDAVKEIMGIEHFVLASPEPKSGIKLSGLFDGI